MNLLKDYLNPLLKWWWLIIAAPLIAAFSAYLFARQLPAVYQAKTTLLIGRAIQDPNPSGNEFSMSYQLATEYASMAKREPVQNAAKAALGLNELPDYEANARGIFLEIAVIHTDPRFAQAVANVLAQQLMLLSPVNTQQTGSTDQLFVQQQLTELQDNIEKTRKDITDKQDSLSGLTSALDIAKTQNELKALEDKMSTLQGIYSNLFASTREAAFNTLSVFDPASLPTVPIGPRKILIVLLAAVSGLAFAVIAAYLIEFLDDTIKNTEEMARLTDVPTIGYIGEMQGFKPTFVASNPRSPTADAFRGLRTNLEFMSVDRPIKTLAVSSAEASDGKSTIAINLAIVIAQSEKKVILIDADLRSPSIHQYLGVQDSPGLSDVFVDRVKVRDALVEWDGTPKFLIMPAGSIPPNSAELLGSNKMNQILDELSEMADIVILDGPPGFVVDAIVLSAKVDGVLMVVNLGETRRGSVKGVVEQFKRIGANIVGMVLNRVTKSSGYYGSYYYSSYYSKKEPVTRPIQSLTSNKKQRRFEFNPRKYLSRLLTRRKMPKMEEVDRVLKKSTVNNPATSIENIPQEAALIVNHPDSQPKAEAGFEAALIERGGVFGPDGGHAEAMATDVEETPALARSAEESKAAPGVAPDVAQVVATDMAQSAPELTTQVKEFKVEIVSEAKTEEAQTANQGVVRTKKTSKKPKAEEVIQETAPDIKAEEIQPVPDKEAGAKKARTKTKRDDVKPDAVLVIKTEEPQAVTDQAEAAENLQTGPETNEKVEEQATVVKTVRKPRTKKT